MADPVLHIKDSYFFEVPKFLTPKERYESQLEVPAFLQAAHSDASLEDFNHAIRGKILIPQPFGTLKNFYEPASGFLISKFMVLEVVAAIILYFVFKRFSIGVSAKEPPRGRWNNAVESVVLFIRNDIARQAIAHHADHYVPILGTLFFFILTLNLMGMIPFLGAATGAFGVTLALAFVVWLVGFLAGIKELGAVGFWTNMVPQIDMPWFMFPLKWLFIVPMLFVIEVAGMVIKHTVLGFRLLANMVAGHLVLLSILGMIVAAAEAATSTYVITAVSGVAGASILSVLELGVAFLQAFVFTFLAALFINMASHAH